MCFFLCEHVGHICEFFLIGETRGFLTTGATGGCGPTNLARQSRDRIIIADSQREGPLLCMRKVNSGRNHNRAAKHVYRNTFEVKS
jgi:hypothetical protein